MTRESIVLKHFFYYHPQHALEIKVVCIFNTYGPHMHSNDGRVVRNLIVQALRGENITIHGNGQPSLSAPSTWEA